MDSRTVLLEEFRRVVGDDTLFSEFLSEIMNQNFFHLLRLLAGDETVLRFPRQFQSFMISYLEHIHELEPAKPYHATASCDLNEELLQDLGITSADAIIVHTRDISDLEICRKFSGFIKSRRFINSSMTKSVELVNLRLDDVCRFNLVSDGVFPLQGKPPGLTMRPNIRVRTLRESGLFCSISAGSSSKVFLLLGGNNQVIITCSRIGTRGFSQFAIALPACAEYILYPFSSIALENFTVSISSFSGAGSCKIN